MEKCCASRVTPSRRKLEIARQYLVKKQRERTGLSEKNIVFKDEPLFLKSSRYYTREAGVRNLEREIGGNVCRKVARKVSMNKGVKNKEKEISAANIS